MLKNNSVEEDWGGGRPQRYCNALIPLHCDLMTFAQYCVMCDSYKKIRSKQKYQKQRCINNYVCGKTVRTYFKCTQGFFLCIELLSNHKFSKTMET